MKDECLAVKISFPESDLTGATIYLEDWQAEQLKARVDANNRCLRSHGFPADYTIAMPSTLRSRCILEAWKEKNPRKQQLPGDSSKKNYTPLL